MRLPEPERTPAAFWLTQPCRDAGCNVVTAISEGPLRRGIVVQHGPNPEHRTHFDAVSIMKNGQSNYLTAIRDWLARVHSPQVWGSDDVEVTL